MRNKEEGVWTFKGEVEWNLHYGMISFFIFRYDVKGW